MSSQITRDPVITLVNLISLGAINAVQCCLIKLTIRCPRIAILNL